MYLANYVLLIGIHHFLDCASLIQMSPENTVAGRSRITLADFSEAQHYTKLNLV